jgi:uncharacterized protein (DUF2384 family)
MNNAFYRKIGTKNYHEPKNPKAKIKQMTDYEYILSELTDLVGEKDALDWLETPNEVFDGQTPAQLIREEKHACIDRMIYQLKSGEPG